MSWSDAVPNLLIGLREGLEAGLVVSILLATLRKASPDGRPISSAPIWLGVVGAVSVAGSFAAVLTYSTDVLSSRAEEAVGGILSVLAVVLVTGMVFWMRRTSSNLSAHLRGDIERAVTIGSGALAVTAFLAVGREGLETTLFLWTAVRASGQTTAPLVGAGLGLAAAITLCWLLYRRAVRLDLGKFFARTAIALIVIAAGILAYGLGDLQDASLLPGVDWVAFDLTAHIDPSSWWVTLISGATELTPRMTVLQVVAWVTYLAVVLPAFLTARTTHAAPGTAREPASSRWERLVARRPWPAAGALVVTPVAAALVAITLLPSTAAASTTAVTVTASQCAPEWTSADSGTQTFSVDNESDRAGEINLDNSSGAIVAEIETIGPATTATMTATLGPGDYSFKCLLAGQPSLVSAPVTISGHAAHTTAAITPVTVAELTGPNEQYEGWVSRHLTTLAGQVAQIEGDLQSGDLAAARRDWLTAQMTWEEVGASYDSFGTLGLAIDGLPEGAHDPDFTGLHRLEYGLWHGQSAATLLPVANQLGKKIGALQHHVTSDAVAGDPTNLPVRAHEILEDALRDHLSGIDDEGAGAAYPETYADLQVTRQVLGELAPLIDSRAPRLLPQADTQMTTLQNALLSTRSDNRWMARSNVPTAAREQVDAAIGALLETLSSVPDLLEVPPTP